MATLDKASAIHPNTRWWVKADGCDLVSGLEESVKLEWNGDADYRTSAVQELYNTYRSRLDSVNSLVSDIPIVEPDRRQTLFVALKREYNSLCGDVNFIVAGSFTTCNVMNMLITCSIAALQKASDSYSAKVDSASEKKVVQLAWNVDDLNRLSSLGRSMRTEVISLKEILEDSSTDIVALNVAGKLYDLKKRLSEFVKGVFPISCLCLIVLLLLLGLYKHKRTAATHIMVVMISTESRVRKPYALPVQCFSYVGITVNQMRAILDRVITAMKARNMAVNGILHAHMTVFTNNYYTCVQGFIQSGVVPLPFILA